MCFKSNDATSRINFRFALTVAALFHQLANNTPNGILETPTN